MPIESSNGTFAYDAEMGRIAEAYLAMWQALSARDPAADRWSEPVELGSASERRVRAERAVAAAAAGSSKTAARELRRDHRRFSKQIEELSLGAPFDEKARGLLRRFRDEGLRVADDAVHNVRAQGRS